MVLHLFSSLDFGTESYNYLKYINVALYRGVTISAGNARITLAKQEVSIFRTWYSPRRVLRTLAIIPEKGSIRGVARATGHDKDTISKWLEIAETHCEEVTKYFLQNLNLTRVDVDEIWEFIQKQKNLKDVTPKSMAMSTHWQQRKAIRGCFYVIMKEVEILKMLWLNRCVQNHLWLRYLLQMTGIPLKKDW